MATLERGRGGYPWLSTTVTEKSHVPGGLPTSPQLSVAVAASVPEENCTVSKEPPVSAPMVKLLFAPLLKTSKTGREDHMSMCCCFAVANVMPAGHEGPRLAVGSQAAETAHRAQPDGRAARHVDTAARDRSGALHECARPLALQVARIQVLHLGRRVHYQRRLPTMNTDPNPGSPRSGARIDDVQLLTGGCTGQHD